MERTDPKLDGAYAGTIRKIARLRGYPERRVREGVKRGEIPVYQPPGAWAMVRLADVDAWFRSHQVSPTTRARERVAEVLAREGRPT